MWGDNSTLQITHNAVGHQFKYTMGIMDYEEEVHESSWGSSTVFFPVDRDQDVKQTSHEIQISSESDGPLLCRWLLLSGGRFLYYLRSYLASYCYS